MPRPASLYTFPASVKRTEQRQINVMGTKVCREPKGFAKRYYCGLISDTRQHLYEPRMRAVFQNFMGPTVSALPITYSIMRDSHCDCPSMNDIYWATEDQLECAIKKRRELRRINVVQQIPRGISKDQQGVAAD